MPRRSHKDKCLELIASQALIRYLLAENSDEEDDVLEESLEELNVAAHYRYGVDFIHGSVEKSRSWWELLPNIDEGRFREMMRMDWHQFQIVMNEIKDDPVFKSKQQFPVEIQLMVVLYRLGSYGEGASVAKIATLFGIGDEGTVEILTRRVFVAILRKKNKYLKWPDANERMEIVADTHSELPYCVGYVDGTEIPLAEKPCVSADDYYSRKQQFSIKAQVVCDHKYIVRTLTVGYPGSVRDARIFAQSSIGRRTSDFLTNLQWIAGDSAYKLTTSLITPFKKPPRGSLTDDQKAFNKIFSRYRVRVEHCIGQIKERFNSLKQLKVRIRDRESAVFCCQWFTVCVLLHNMIKMTCDEDPFEADIDNGQEADCLQNDDPDEGYLQVDTVGEEKRKAIFEIILN
uniref:Putative nuclease HARBI1 n=1 Tax=Lygus hesperus TaxID=30085 RepID=A0A0A9Z5Y3_LYGHE